MPAKSKVKRSNETSVCLTGKSSTHRSQNSMKIDSADRPVSTAKSSSTDETISVVSIQEDRPCRSPSVASSKRTTSRSLSVSSQRQYSAKNGATQKVSADVQPTKYNVMVMQDRAQVKFKKSREARAASTGRISATSSTSIGSSRTSSLPPVTKHNARSSYIIDTRARSIESQFHFKMKKLEQVKKELVDKQKISVELITDANDLRAKYHSLTGRKLGTAEDESRLEALKHGSVSLMRKDAAEEKEPDPQLCEAFSALELDLVSITENMMEMFKCTMSNRSVLWDYLKQLCSNKKCPDMHVLNTYSKDGEALTKKVETMKSSCSEDIRKLQKNVRTLMEGWDKFSKVKETFDNENGDVVQVRKDLENKISLLEYENNDMSLKLKKYVDDLEAEKEKANGWKEKKLQSEAQLRTARQKIKDLEGKLTHEDTKLSSMTSQVKLLETQVKQKDQGLDKKVVELQKALKTSTEASHKLERQREGLEYRVTELKQEKSINEAAAKNKIEQLNLEMEDISERLKEEHVARQKVEKELNTVNKKYESLKMKTLEVAAMVERTTELYISGQGSDHTSHEEELMVQLNATRLSLSAAKEVIEQLKQEKLVLMNACEEPGNGDRAVAAREEVMRNELAIKDEVISQLKRELNGLLPENISVREQCQLYKRQLSEFQLEMYDDDDHKALQIMELQQQVIDLRASLGEAVAKNQKLEKTLIQTQLEIEQRDRVMKSQGTAMYCKDKLLNYLKQCNQKEEDAGFSEPCAEMEENPDEMYALPEISEFIESLKEANMVFNDDIGSGFEEKAKELEELYSLLQVKQKQVYELEDVIKQLEEQQERSQLQRTRNEARIAHLEKALHNKEASSRYTSEVL